MNDTVFFSIELTQLFMLFGYLSVAPNTGKCSVLTSAVKYSQLRFLNTAELPVCVCLSTSATFS